MAVAVVAVVGGHYAAWANKGQERTKQMGGDQGRGNQDNRGQNKTWNVTNPTTGETRTVTTREWREQKLGQQGFEKPVDLEETVEDETSGGTDNTGSQQ